MAESCKPVKKSKLFFSTVTPVKVTIYQRIYTSDLAGFLTHRTDKRPEMFAPYKQVWSLDFLCTTAAHCNVFVLDFLLDFLKWNSTLCYVYWIPEVNSLFVFCLQIHALAGQTKNSKLFITHSASLRASLKSSRSLCGYHVRLFVNKTVTPASKSFNFTFIISSSENFIQSVLTTPLLMMKNVSPRSPSRMIKSSSWK